MTQEEQVRREQRVRWIYSSKDNRELEERYDQWARDYDTDLAEGFGWIGPQKACEAFAHYVPASGRVLDAGAGTGLCGFILAKMRFTDLVAMDLSQGMLEEARKKGVYEQLDQAVLGERLPYADNKFDGVICVGTLTVGHAPPESFDDLIRVTRPGGYIVFSMRPDTYENAGFKEKQAALEAEGQWRFVEATDKFQTLPKGEPDVYHQDWVYQVA